MPSTAVTPFRYPGGKAWLVDRLAMCGAYSPEKPLVDLFCGGGSVGVALADRGWCSTALLNDRDYALYNFFKVCAENGGELAELLENLHFASEQDVVDLLTPFHPDEPFLYAVQTIVQNRCNFGGMMKNDKVGITKFVNGKPPRWNPATCAAKVRNLHEMFRQGRLLTANEDALVLLDEFAGCDFAWFIDPPYFEAGRELYTHWEIDHEELFRAVSNLRGSWVMSYDDSPQILDLIGRFGFTYVRVPMQCNSHAKKEELVIYNKRNRLCFLKPTI